MRIAMIGTGYVGLVSGACFSDFGHEVTCIDKDAAKIAQLRGGTMPIFEPGLDMLVARNVEAGRLLVHHRVRQRDPLGRRGLPGGRHAVAPRRRLRRRLVRLWRPRARSPARSRTSPSSSTKSTVPVGTERRDRGDHPQGAPDADFAVVSNPEFLREGAAIEDFKHPDRVVVGADDERARRVMREIYRPLFINETPILFTGRRTAELIKYASNAFLATKITFINEMADLCEKAGADVQEVARGMGLDRRIGPEVPARRAGLRRLLLSEGHRGADRDRPASRHAAAHRRDRDRRQQRAQGGDGGQGRGRLRRLGAGKDDCGARAHVQAEHRRHARSAVDS